MQTMPSEGLSSSLHSPCEAGHDSIYICNSSVPVGRWEAEEGEAPEAQTAQKMKQRRDPFSNNIEGED